MSSTRATTLTSVKQLVKSAKRNRKNRVYYQHGFSPKTRQDIGAVVDEKRAYFDRVILEDSQNEHILMMGFDTTGSHFELELSIFSLYPDVQRPRKESQWRLAKIELLYYNPTTQAKYSYRHQTLIDYHDRKRNSAQHDKRNVYKIGSLSLEIIAPFTHARLSFCGELLRELDGKEELVPAKLSISTHPTCDKFDYKYKFSSKYLSELIHKSMTEKKNAKQLLDLVLEDRIDSTMMFQGSLELLNSGQQPESFLMWGAKAKWFIDALQELSKNSSQPIESLYMWVECGHYIHLNRPVEHPSLVYGMLTSPYDYPSQIHAASCSLPNGAFETDFGRLASFSNLAAGVKMNLRGYKLKDYSVELVEGVEGGKLFRVKINDFYGWGFCRTHDLGEQLRFAQAQLWTLNIHDAELGRRLASETLLGGKGNSLVQLNCVLQETEGPLSDSLGGKGKCDSISVPRGLVISCTAYQMWLNSSPLIASTIRDLDSTRRVLSAKSVELNPYSDKYLTLAQQQQVLREQCKRTNLVLNSCPLPAILKQHLYLALRSIFGDQDLKDPVEGEDEETSSRRKKFAVRSSAMGEDSLETSAAGQMRTILDACGFEAICKSIIACWASQFEPEAVTYKTQNGLLFNWPMAVVVQELINCKSAGVAATCNPLTGNPRELEILANLGMGEGVVSGKRTDTIRVNLEHLAWNPNNETHDARLRLEEAQGCITKIIDGQATGSDQAECCIDNQQIVTLSNFLIWLSKRSSISKREIEWGITNSLDDTLSLSPVSATKGEQQDRRDSNVSSSSYGSTISSVSRLPDKKANNHFRLHLLQSRPLTNMNRLNSDEIRHELDDGFESPLEFVSRANLGEVMPGALSPMFYDHFLLWTRSNTHRKPYTKDHTELPGAAGFMGMYSGVVSLVLTNGETVSKFAGVTERREQLSLVIGSDNTRWFEGDKMERFQKEKIHPFLKSGKMGIGKLLALSNGLVGLHHMIGCRDLNKMKLQRPMRGIDLICEELTNPRREKLSTETQSVNNASLAFKGKPTDPLTQSIRTDILTLYDRLCQENSPLSNTWHSHLSNTSLSMALNIICITLLGKQKPYAENADKSVLLNDYSDLVRGGSFAHDTESGAISLLLENLTLTIFSEGLLKQFQRLSAKELYDQLISSENKSKSASMFKKFMKDNGHRAFKEFDYCQSTWGDDPSFIIKSLQTRLKRFNPAQFEEELRRREVKSKETTEKARQVLDKVESGRFILEGYLLKRTRASNVSREKSKSLLIRTVHSYRLAFRHLGGLLCLEGRLPDASLIYFLTFDEVGQLIRQTDENRADLARLIYKARRRQQTTRPLDKLKLPKPSMNVIEFMDVVNRTSRGEIIDEGSGAASMTLVNIDGIDPSCMVRGITSCGGLVTGRAFVATLIDDMEEVQQGDILITYSIDVSWSLYFFSLAGVVTEVGGIVSHGAVIAREYGIPTLCTAIGATHKFKTGQMITLDANRGICYPADALSSATSSSAASDVTRLGSAEAATGSSS